jgi:hypothetical protein
VLDVWFEVEVKPRLRGKAFEIDGDNRGVRSNDKHDGR